MKHLLIIFAIMASGFISEAKVGKSIDSTETEVLNTSFNQRFFDWETGEVEIWVEGTYNVATETVNVTSIIAYYEGEARAINSYTIHSEFPGGNFLLGGSVSIFQGTYSFGIQPSR
ncbi:hypothetical protein KI659_05515 [Litoribacter alkaliphilus]|uniref:Uncharacterized protein n=1 Tax=Litoribacter ruber TaxID=702568 RepID=A0AAP2G3I2_9BACT|nr:hypothetical protein [Litoribacter alkaliphilus]MBS9523475.1 hypothetical protein [Litoribacter alkaliphilus]